MNIKVQTIVYIILLFLAQFIFSTIFLNWSNPLTAIIFPVNESIWETTKLKFISIVIINLAFYYTLTINFRRHVPLAVLVHTFVTAFSYNILILLINPSNPLIIQIISIFSILVGTYFWFKIITSPFSYKVINHSALLLIFNCFVLFSILTYHPLPNNIFYDEKNNMLGMFKFYGDISN